MGEDLEQLKQRIPLLDYLVWPNTWKVLKRRRFQLSFRLPVHPAW
jgi:hypothetical protein